MLRMFEVELAIKQATKNFLTTRDIWIAALTLKILKNAIDIWLVLNQIEFWGDRLLLIELRMFEME